MSRGRFDFALCVGEDLTFTVQTSGDLTGCSAVLKARAAESMESLPIFSLSTSGGQIVLGGVAGTVTVTLNHVTSGALVPGTYFYNCILVDTLGKVLELFNGICKITFNESA